MSRIGKMAITIPAGVSVRQDQAVVSVEGPKGRLSQVMPPGVDIAIQERDHASNNMLQWYVAEQVEEEANASLILEQLKRIGNAQESLYVLDKELGMRVFNDATGTINPIAGGAA